MSLGEFDIIAKYFTRTTQRRDVLLGVGDDAAVVSVPQDRRLVVAIDTLVEDVHFPGDTAAADIGHRALAVNLSDLAAMGAEPAWMTLSLSLPDAEEGWIRDFAAGLHALAGQFNVALIGGDTVKGPRVITVQVAGWVETDRWLTRAGAQAGDVLFVSGVPGEAAAGLATIQRHLPDSPAITHLRSRFLRPTPRVELGRWLRPIASAAMDISDGLLTDLDKLCAASGCGARIDLDALPDSISMRAAFDAQSSLDFTLAGGDDYELLFAVPPAAAKGLEAMSPPVVCRSIGMITADRKVECLRNGMPIDVRRRGYDHFGNEARS
jgi:thiamine-monophosphate kinase